MSDVPTTTSVRAFSAEGARVGIVTCLTCGAALLIDPDDNFDVTERHASWHEAQDADTDE